jgi:hypothetical protein
MLSINATPVQTEVNDDSTSKVYAATEGRRVYSKEEFFGTVAADIDGTEDIADLPDWLSPYDGQTFSYR